MKEFKIWKMFWLGRNQDRVSTGESFRNMLFFFCWGGGRNFDPAFTGKSHGEHGQSGKNRNLKTLSGNFTHYWGYHLDLPLTDDMIFVGFCKHVPSFPWIFFIKTTQISAK